MADIYSLLAAGSENWTFIFIDLAPVEISRKLARMKPEQTAHPNGCIRSKKLPIQAGTALNEG